jgi:hypothetical protein
MQIRIIHCPDGRRRISKPVVLCVSFALSFLFAGYSLIQSNNILFQPNDNLDLNPFLTSKQQRSKALGSGVIFTSYLRFQQDPRIAEQLEPPTFQTIYHFYTSVVHNRLHAVIFYDELSFDEEFVKQFAYPPYIRFHKVQPADRHLNPNDLRFRLYLDYLNEHGREYNWYLFADMDMLFNRNPFVVLEYLRVRYGHEYVGSHDGGHWRQGGAQYTQYPKCFEVPSELLPSVPNGNCGLWAARYKYAHCILDCMSETFAKPPVEGKGNQTPCDMAVHDHCIFYGGCFPNTTKGLYAGDLVLQQAASSNSLIRWGEETQNIDYHSGHGDLFGPTVQDTEGRNMCVRKNWTVSHLRCGKKQKGSICFDHSSLSFPLQDMITGITGKPSLSQQLADDEDPKSIKRFIQNNFHFTSECRLNFTSGMPLRPKKGKMFVF